jgi:uncharacterized membrane protein YfcA
LGSEPLANPWFLAVAIPAVVLTGISKGGLGFAGGLSVPILSLAISPVQAAGIMLPILIVTDLVGVYAYRKHWDRKNVAILMPAGVLGIGLGWLTFRYLNDDWIRILLGLISCSFVAYNVLGKVPPPAPPNRVKGYVCGAASGFTSFVAHAGGPPLSIYLLPQRLEIVRYVGTTIVYFSVINALKIVPYFELGLFEARNLWTAITLLPLAIAGVLLGLWLRKRIGTTWFYRSRGRCSSSPVRNCSMTGQAGSWRKRNQ